jgi:plastocyanin
VGHRALIIPVVLLLAAAAAGGEVRGTVVVAAIDGGVETPAPQPVVVYLTGFKQPALPDSPVVGQKDKTFIPDLRVVVAGQSVQFTNDDPFVHNVFSTSAARMFDLGQPGPHETRTVKFDTPGLVDVFCNIHEQMYANVLVLPNRAFARVAPDGTFVIRDVPPGRHPLHAWGRQTEPFEMEVVVAEGQPTEVQLVLRPRLFNPAHLDKFGRAYKNRPGYAP